MALDPNIILQGKPPQINPMEIAQHATALQTGMNQNRLFASDFGARQAIGEHYRASIDPQSGQLDTNRLTGLVAGDPRSAFRAGEVAKDALERQRQQAQLAPEQVKAYQAHLSVLGDAITPLLASKEPLTRDAVIGSAVNVINNPSLPPELRQQITNDVTGFLGSLPPNATPEQIRSALQQIQLQTMDTQERFNAVYGSPVQVDTGARIEQGSFSPMTGYKPAGSFDKTLSPSDLSTPTQIGVGPGGEPIMGTKEQFIQKATGAGGVATGLPAGQAEFATTTAKRANEIQTYAASSPARLTAMQSVRSLVPTTPGTAFGPTGNLTSQIQKVAAGLGIAPEKIVSGQASLDEINKSLSLIAAAQGQAMGAGTDASREMVHNANPSLANSKEGLLRNLSVVEGNERYAVAKNRALQEWLSTHPASTTAQFEAAFNKNFTPMALQVQTMPQHEQKRVWESLSGKQNKDGTWTGEKGRFLKTMDMFSARGWSEGQ